jgi:hypothetical protein
VRIVPKMLVKVDFFTSKRPSALSEGASLTISINWKSSLSFSSLSLISVLKNHETSPSSIKKI